MNVTFTSTSGGTRSGAAFIKDNAPGSPQKLRVSGTGGGTGSIIFTLSPSSLDFGSVVVGSTSSPQTATVTNIGTAAASFVSPFGFTMRGSEPEILRGAVVLWHQPGTELELYGGGDLQTQGERGADRVFRGLAGGRHCSHTLERHGYVEPVASG